MKKTIGKGHARTPHWKVVTAATALAWLAYAGTSVAGFGSATGKAETHQYIIREALTRLQKTGVLRSRFPALHEILAFEGVSLDLGGNVVGGEGPDAKAPYSWHYYNPLTKQGQAPAKAKDYFEILRRAGTSTRVVAGEGGLSLLGGRLPDEGETPAKAAAYLAHFIADLSSPYHVAGQPREEVRKPVGTGETVVLDFPVVGPGSAFVGNWSEAVAAFYEDPTEPDWFDPWYWNGRRILFGTHAWLEVSAWSESLVRSADPRPGYSPLFLSMLPVAAGQAGASVARFAEQRALETYRASEPIKRSAAKAWFDWINDPIVTNKLGLPLGTGVVLPKAPTYEGWGQYGELIEQAIQDVYTTWRASVSALEPEVTVDLGTTVDAANPVVVTVTNWEATEPATGVSVEVEVQGGRLIGPASYALSEPIAPHRAIDLTGVWKVQPAASLLRIRVHVRGGSFSSTPDAGEAWIDKTIPTPSASTSWDPWRDVWFYSGPVAIKATQYYMHTKLGPDGRAAGSTDEKARLTCASRGVVKLRLDSAGSISGVLRATEGSYPAAYERQNLAGVATDKEYACVPIEQSRQRDYLPYASLIRTDDVGRPGEGLDVFGQMNERDGTRVGVGMRNDRLIYLRGDAEVLGRDNPGGALAIVGAVDGASNRGRDVRTGGNFRLGLSLPSPMAGQQAQYRDLAVGRYSPIEMFGAYSSQTDNPVDSSAYYTKRVVYEFTLRLERVLPPGPPR